MAENDFACRKCHGKPEVNNLQTTSVIIKLMAQYLFNAIEEMSSDPLFKTKSSVAASALQAALTLRAWCQDVQNRAACEKFCEILV